MHLKKLGINKIALGTAVALLVLALACLGFILIKHQSRVDGIPVLGYHNIVSQEDKDSLYGDNQYCLSIEQFSEEMKLLHDKGYKTLSAREVCDYYEGRMEVPSKVVALTFDDGYASFNTMVKPILEKYGFKATCFAMGHHLRDKDPNFLHVKDVVKDEYAEYYSHSYDLHHKDRASGKKKIQMLSIDEIDKDFNRCKLDCTYFAFPYGKTVKGIDKVLKKHNVKLAFSYNQYYNLTRKDNPYYLPRYMVLDYMPMSYFKWMIQ